MNLKEYIGNTVKKRREELNLEQSYVQDYTDIGSVTISKLENAKANISLDNLEKIIDFLGLEMKIVVKTKGKIDDNSRDI